MGFSRAVAFRRTRESHDPRTAFAFEGVEDSFIGGHGLHMGGAAGYEVDAADFAAGTPAHALIVATADDFGGYANTDSRVAPRADMIFYETPAGGAVFSFSSITWSGSLSWNSYDNSVSTLTRNVIRRFLDPEPFTWPSH
jgi:N,N-dimethylformamidase